MKKFALLLSLATISLPFTTLAASDTLQTLLVSLPEFFDDIIIPFLFGIAFLVFAINAIRFFVLEGSSEEGRDRAKNLMIYSVAAFTFLVIFFGIVNILSSSSGLGGEDQPCSDYQETFGTCP